MTIGEGYLKKAFELKNGYVEVPKGPGLGIELDKEFVEEKTYDGKRETPRLFHEDGSVANW